MDNRKAQKILLIGFEKLVEKYQQQLLPKAPLILKMFYDTDILEEDAILEWASKVNCDAIVLERQCLVCVWVQDPDKSCDIVFSR